MSIDISYITSKTFEEASVDPVLNIVPLGNSVNIDKPVWSIAITTYPCDAIVSNWSVANIFSPAQPWVYMTMGKSPSSGLISLPKSK